ncbi:MAG: TIGR03986 family CRISPR-associated RAMP protein [Clostridium sp.]|nr:TIGR03986 family CRISPR-associated RAMP protein [Clostridium sp.]MCM1172866.1 TIGR03986 family CRISPR-associated RAMP protein [Clostridium sp.]
MANSNNKQNQDSYVGAPYNFVPFYKNIVEVDPERMSMHDRMIDEDGEELLTGEINYTLKAESPIYVSDGKDFFTNERGKYCIPGSTMRGLIRNNAHILGLSSFEGDIDDYNLMYRSVVGGLDKKRYAEVLCNVAAGYIRKDKDEYRIYKTVVDAIKPNYYVVSERAAAKEMSAYPFFKDHSECAQHVLEDGFEPQINRNGSTEYVGKLNKNYKPGWEKITYEIDESERVSHLGAPGVYNKKGVIVNTGYMRNKKCHYIVPEIAETKDPIVLSKNDIRAFEIDYNKRSNVLGENKEFFKLPEEGEEEKPVFYIEYDGRVYFGFTPRLRLFYKHSILDGYKIPSVQCDYARSIFGTVNQCDNAGYKSKVAFSDAIAYSVTKGDTTKVILAEPKPTSVYDYVVQENGEKTYNSEDFELRGIKQYWLHGQVQSCVVKDNKVKVATDMYPLKAGTIFKGTIHFHDLSEDELGLLIWSIRLEEGTRMNVGRGKPFGYGVVSVSDVTVRTVNNKLAYSLGGGLSVDPFVAVKDYEKLIAAYKHKISKLIGGKSIDGLKHIQTFMNMKMVDKIPENEKTRYMELNEYQKRKNAKKALPIVEDIIKK